MLVVLVMNDREVQNRIIQLERHHGAEELRRAANFLNENCRGRTLAQVRQELLSEFKETHAHLNQVMLDAISVAQQVFEQTGAAGSHRVRDRGRDQPDGACRAVQCRQAQAPVRGLQREARHPATCSTTACGPRACRSSSGTSPVTRSWMTAAWSPRRTAIARAWSACSASSAPRAWPTRRVIPIVDMTAKLLGSALNSRR